MESNNFDIISYRPDDGTNFIKDNKKVLWKFLDDGYRCIGYSDGFKGCTNERSLGNNAILVRVAYHDKDIVAVSVYTGYLGGHKCVGITATTDPALRSIGKEAVKKIIQTDLKLYKEFYWCECSGSIEHLFKEYKAIAIPNEYAEAIIGKVESLDDDGFHYDRYIGNNLETKVIYGFNSKGLYERVKKEHEEYIKDSERQLREYWGLMESDQKFRELMLAKGIVDIFIRMRYEWDTYEFSKESMDKLKENLKIINNAIETGAVPDSYEDIFKNSAEYGKNVLDSSTYLEMH